MFSDPAVQTRLRFRASCHTFRCAPLRSSAVCLGSVPRALSGIGRGEEAKAMSMIDTSRLSPMSHCGVRGPRRFPVARRRHRGSAPSCRLVIVPTSARSCEFDCFTLRWPDRISSISGDRLNCPPCRSQSMICGARGSCILTLRQLQTSRLPSLCRAVLGAHGRCRIGQVRSRMCCDHFGGPPANFRPIWASAIRHAKAHFTWVRDAISSRDVLGPLLLRGSPECAGQTQKRNVLGGQGGATRTCVRLWCAGGAHLGSIASRKGQLASKA